MQKNDITDHLRANPYPGRGIIIGTTKNDNKPIIVYFIMGRSINSRNRIITETADGIMTQAHDPALMTDPGLVIYHPVRCLDISSGQYHIVTNGDQTDTIYEHMTQGKTIFDALMTRTFEPDPPNYTPRISGLVYPDGSYMLSILKTHESDPSCCLRQYFTYDTPQPGTAYYISTYTGDGDPLPSFIGEPICISLEENYSSFAESVWNSLNEENKVALYACEIDPANGTKKSLITNKLM